MPPLRLADDALLIFGLPDSQGLLRMPGGTIFLIAAVTIAVVALLTGWCWCCFRVWRWLVTAANLVESCEQREPLPWRDTDV